MKGSLFKVSAGVFALGLAGSILASVGSARAAFNSDAVTPPVEAMTSAPVATIPKRPSGLTEQGIKIARESGMPSRLVTMAPQSNLGLLARASELGPHAQASAIQLTVALKLRNEIKLRSFLEQVQNPASPVYRQWLTPAEFTRLYGPTQADVTQVVAFLKAHGIKVMNVSNNRMLIHTEAATRVYERALGIRINDYKLNGRSFYSTADRPKLPSVIAPLVVNILGLNHGQQMRPHIFRRPLTGANGLSPRQAPPASLTNLNPLQIAHAYNYPDITDAGNGKGVQVAILTAASSGLASLSDPHDFWTVFGLPDHRINVIPVDGDNGDSSGIGETLLDIEYSGAMGPGATFDVYVAADTSSDTFTDMFNRFANAANPDGTVKNQVMTTSWGHPEIYGGSADVTDNQIFMQAASEGISMFAAAGDGGSGDNTGQDNVADFPSSSPYIAAANGTQLNISDAAGDYGSEVVWNDADCFGNGPMATGGAVSQDFDKPDWQTGPGVPTDIDMRMNSDMAATASCTKPLLVMQNGQWILAGGTSAVAPQFAGLFAIAVADNGGEPLGQSNELIYADANSHYASDFRDVTRGDNGTFEAGPDWDHPTGWGSPNVRNFLSHIGVQGPRGTLEGTVTDAESGAPVAGATITAVSGGVDYKAITRDDGSYSRLLPVGDFSVTVESFGYNDGAATVSISDGQATKQNFGLEAAPTATLSGKVTDGSGHGYGLYAQIKVNTQGVGQVAEVWTDPATGKYSVKLPKGFEYALNVAAAFDGYNTAAAEVDLANDQAKEFSLSITGDCSAPGYAFTALGEDFNGADFPPDGWEVTNAISGSPIVWKLNTGWKQDNWTGGTGTAADMDSGDDFTYYQAHDSSLVTPPIAVSALSSGSILSYKANYSSGYGSDALDLDISANGSDQWTTIQHWTQSHGAYKDLPGEAVSINLAPYVPKDGTFRLRWRNYDLGSFAIDGYAQIDNVAIGVCRLVPGGLVYGRVTDANTGDGLVGAHVKDDLGAGADTVANASDPNWLPGTYLFFVSKGGRVLSASGRGYVTDTANVTVGENTVVRQDFALNAPRFEAHPDSLTLHVLVNSSATASFALKNTGSAAGMFHVIPIDALPPLTGAAAIPVRRVSVKHPEWAQKTLYWIRAQSQKDGSISSLAASSMPPSGFEPDASSWLNIVNYPIIVGDNVAAFDASTGKVYSVGGNAGETATYVYNSGANAWMAVAAAPIGREAPVGEFINGKLYLAGGVNPSYPSGIQELDVYNAAKNNWANAYAPMPYPVYGAASVVLYNRMYVIGGEKPVGFGGGVPVKTVQIYDPASNTWSLAKDYPEAIGFEACGAIAGKIYCAGGFGTSSGASSDGYVYDPATNEWSPIEDVKITGGVAGPLYGTANNELILVGGFVGSAVQATNQAEAYDPATGSWTSLPNTNEPVSRAGGTCGGDGFYTVGSMEGSGGGLYTSTDEAQRLPGYVCTGGGVPWPTVAPAIATLASGNTTRVTLDFDAPSQDKEFTTSKVYLKVIGTPYSALTVPITVHWDPQPVSLVLSGVASPDSIRKGDNLAYTLTIENTAEADHGAATETRLTYELPPGTIYVSASGEGASCTAPTGTAPAPAVATNVAGMVSCDFGTLAQGDSRTVTIAVKAERAGKLTSHFEVSAREPDDSGKNALDVSTTVIGTADLGIGAEAATLTAGSGGTLHLTVSNAGPDPATEVKLKLGAGANVRLQSAASAQGTCAPAGAEIECELGEIGAGGEADVKVEVFGISAGSTQLTAQATTTADDAESGNNVATAQVTVEATGDGGSGGGDGGGGGALGWLGLAALLALAFAGLGLRYRRRA